MAEEMIMEEQEMLELMDAEGEKTFVKKIRGVTPMLFLSLAMHLVLFLILALIREERVVEAPTIVITTPPPHEDPIVDDPPVIDPPVIKKPTLVDVVDQPQDEPESEDLVEVEDNPLETEDLPEVFSEIPVESPNLNVMNNLAALTMSGSPNNIPSGSGIFGDRFGPKKIGTGPNGPTAASEDAVNSALRWLAEHQEPDGSWNAEKYEGHFKWGNQKEIDQSVMTAMALLPFLGAGHTEKNGEYRRTVQKGVRYINQTMSKPELFKKGKGHFTRMYGSGLVLMALSETSLFGSSDKTRRHANRIAEYLIDVYLEKPGQGWHYNGPGDDFSVSGWVALGLKSAKYAGLEVMGTEKAKRVMDGYRQWTHEVMTDPETGKGKYRNGGGHAHSMTLVGMFAKQFLGFPKSDPFLVKATKNVEQRVAVLMNGEKVSDVYQIYYGTLAAYQQDGDLWRSWNGAMKKTLLGSQRRGDTKELGGSWDPTSDHTGKVVGRVGVTALMALCLEVYYRFERYDEGNG